MSEITVTRLQKALNALKNGYKDLPSELERDGLIQRFEYTLELCWKTSKKVLLSHGVEVDTPKNVIRELGQLNWISNPERWIDYIDKRNETHWLYDDLKAESCFKIIKKFIKDADDLILKLSHN